MNIAIVEDEAIYKQQIIRSLHKYEIENNYKFNITSFSDGLDIVENYKANWDILFLDIKMNLMDGLEAAKIIRAMDSKIIIIFITSMVQYAVNGYEVDAMDFVVKPIEFPRLKLTMDKAINRLNSLKNNNFIMLPGKNGLERVSTDDVLYIEVRQHNLYYNTFNAEYIVRDTMKNAELNLSKYNFSRSSNSFLVNLKNVSAIKGSEVSIRDKMVPLSRSRKKEFTQKLSAFLLDGSLV